MLSCWGITIVKLFAEDYARDYYHDIYKYICIYIKIVCTGLCCLDALVQCSVPL